MVLSDHQPLKTPPSSVQKQQQPAMMMMMMNKKNDANNNNNNVPTTVANNTNNMTENKHGRHDSTTSSIKNNNNNNNNKEKKDRAKARWSILRNALLQNCNNQMMKPFDESSESQSGSSIHSHSIHRFPGYQLLKPQHQNNNQNQNQTQLCREMESSLKVFDFLDYYHHPKEDDDDDDRSSSVNVVDLLIEKLEIAILALCAVYPKGCCLHVKNITNVISSGDEDGCWIQTIKKNCQIVGINVLVVNNNNNNNKNNKKDDENNNNDTCGGNDVLLLVQEGGRGSKCYQCCQYKLDDGMCSLFTREPAKESSKLSLQDLITHRMNNGVDNTGNICIWDSEKTLAYLLYNHHSDIILSSSNNNYDTNNTHPQRILELGTGMAGLAAVALGLRIIQQQQQQREREQHPRKIQITLTDGHADGVKNNIVNQYLTKVFSSTTTDKNHPYKQLDITTKVLLWTTDLHLLPTKQKNESCSSSSTSSKNEDTTRNKLLYDIVLISDCIHFQNFHAALAITAIRNLNVGGKAIFCQPTRGDSLDNFCKLLLLQQQCQEGDVVDVTANNNNIDNKLVNLEFRKHPIIEEQHQKAIAKYNNNNNENENDNNIKNALYDENLHYPKILIVTKLRELTELDCKELIERHQQIRQK